MLLLIDAGNTRIKWAVALRDARQPGQWAASGAVGRGDLDQLAAEWGKHSINHVMLSNVAGEVMRGRLDQVLSKVLGLRPVGVEVFRSVPALAGIRNTYRDPAQLGSDRFAAAIGAVTMEPGQALIVATCGTATTIDAIDAQGTFLGGMILPGLGLMAESLARNTAQLPEVGSSIGIVSPFADNTDDAIISGCIAAQTGAIERAVAAHAAMHGAVSCLISGGAAGMVAPHLSIPSRQVDNLVLIGLHRAVIQSHASC